MPADVIIPNTAPIVLIHFWDDGWERYNILAWRISDGYITTPITTSCDDYETDHQIYCYEEHVGEVTLFIFPLDCECSTFEKARDHAREQIELQQENFRKRAEKRRSAVEVS